jgi:predicted restriction endonuclease
MGGKVTAIKLRSIALDRYNLNPNYCIYCGNKIEIKTTEKVQQVRRRKFCNSACAASFNNHNRKKIIRIKPKIDKFDYEAEFMGLTKGEARIKYKTYQSFRALVRRYANKVFWKENNKMCLVCGYTRHVEVAHRRAVSEFDDSALMSEINSIDNLIGLCPTHHWEYDNKFISL